MYKNKKYSFDIALVLFLGMLTLTACGSNEVTQPGSDNNNEGSSATEVVQPSLSESPTLAVNDLPVSTDSASSSAGTPELGFALGDPKLKATDPSTVSLASGQIQVIEFFAFW